jgi:hypothetical protein
VDAIGERGGTLLLVSCKALPYSDAWDRGEYRVVRNVASHVANAVAEWRDRVAEIKANPVGDNFDFSAYRRIVGVVVYPHTPWTTSREATLEVASGLRAASSASEIATWCRRAKW